MRKNKKRYTRNLGLRTMFLVLVFGIVGTSLGCGFVHMRTRRVTNGDQKRALEREIVSLEKEITTLESRVAQATDREALVRTLGAVARGLREHFSRRSECRGLVSRLDELGLLADADGRPPRPLPGRGSGPV